MRRKTVRASKRKSFRNRTRKNNSFKRKTMKKRGGYFHFMSLNCNKDNVQDWLHNSVIKGQIRYIVDVSAPFGKQTKYVFQIPGYKKKAYRYSEIKKLNEKANKELDSDKKYELKDSTSNLTNNLKNCKRRILELDEFASYLADNVNDSSIVELYSKFFLKDKSPSSKKDKSPSSKKAKSPSPKKSFNDIVQEVEDLKENVISAHSLNDKRTILKAKLKENKITHKANDNFLELLDKVRDHYRIITSCRTEDIRKGNTGGNCSELLSRFQPLMKYISNSV